MSGPFPSATTGYDVLLKLDREEAENDIDTDGQLSSVVSDNRVIDAIPLPAQDLVQASDSAHQLRIDNDLLNKSEGTRFAQQDSQQPRSRNTNSLDAHFSGSSKPTTPTNNVPLKPSPLRHGSDAYVLDRQHQQRLELPSRVHNQLYGQSNRGREELHGDDPAANGNISNSSSRGVSPLSAELSPFSSPPQPIVSDESPLQRQRSSSVVSISTINDTLARWSRGMQSTYRNLRRGKKSSNVYSYEIYYSVYKLPNWSKSVSPPLTPYVVPVHGLLDSGPVRRDEFQSIVKDVIHAFSHGIEPRRIAQGSSGSYFMYDREAKVVGVFKPQDEEPYGKLSPKWTKWLHRNLFPCFFGRSVLIPNNGYICEAAASVLDRQLQTYIVPFTDTVFMSSPSFYYPYFDRRRYKNASKPLPEKVGSFQLFLHDYEQANVFLRKHPLPNYLDRAGGSSASIYLSQDGSTPPETAFKWSAAVLQQFRLELEKLVILDYIMRNTDRGLDNWMIKLEWKLIEAPGESSNGPYKFLPELKIGAIDSGLSFPWKHPDEWRSYPFGWLFLPLAMIGQPFSRETKEHFLPILCSTQWWEETTIVLREMFNRDPDFRERMWKRQLAVLKGQAFNLVETLKHHDQGPLELSRRTRCMVWDDQMEVPVSVSISTVQNAMDTPMWEDYNDEQEPSSRQPRDEESMIENAPSSNNPNKNQRPAKLDLTPAMARSPARQSISARLSSFSPTQATTRGRKRGGSLALEARFKELQKGGGDIWRQLVNSDALGEPPVDPRSSKPGITVDGVDCNDDDDDETAPLLGPAFEPAIHRAPAEPEPDHLSTQAGWADDELGYAFITGHHATRKVVVERLQTVTSRPPVFTWC
ncbi:1-phosphatidylinositol 4-kinase LSB6 [Sugiyamaella lignohabitans]|uniref:Phosphatidylinositol 4-kinase n=1 Tax=Sugiyamaella lignohabitans TaxID=796027 RepID=A0A167DZP1_9ASCO|nr:1-phosphatidylinositol 4-kinase LSB6 [Sugiyamaella lignohabitans]ANB13475.1 1-phosphatidylinositol 4-kinase LSB6 [Sugiyamaella lignohabitans]